MDPLSPIYPMLSPYQYASNNPILNVDIDGLEGLEYLHIMQKHETQMAKKTPEERRRIEKQGALVFLGIAGLVGVMVVAPEAIPFIAKGFSGLGATGTSTAASVGLWMQQPQNQQLLAEGGAFIAGVIDPNPMAQYYPGGAGDELGNFVGGIFRTVGKRALNYVFRSPAGEDVVTGTASLTEGILKLDFDVPANLRKSGIGTHMFQDALNYFGDNVKGVRGLWVEGDNLNQLNKALKEGMNISDAVFSTPTGKWARQNGYDTFQQVGSAVGEGGFEGIELIFKKSTK